MHLHTATAEGKRGLLLRLAARFIPVVTTQQYLLFYPGDSASAEWCPVCRSGTLYGHFGKSPVASLKSITGRDGTPEIGYIDEFRQRAR